MNIEAFAETAANERIWSHTVGIENRALVTRGTDPATGLRTTELASPGTGVAGVWGEHHFLVTARHVLDNAQVSDLKFFVRQAGELKSKLVSEVTINDAVVGAPLNDSKAGIYRCNWEDLALLAVRSDALGPNLEFFDLRNSCTDPSPGDRVTGVGYPVSNGVLFQQRMGSSLRKAVLLTPVPFSAVVLPDPSADELRFKYPSCVLSKHYLIPYEQARQGMHPGGISGAAVWVEAAEHTRLWAARFHFAGICTSCYRDGTIEQVVKASIVRRFLTEVFGDPGPVPQVPRPSLGR
jgi:hypothetical protein